MEENLKKIMDVKIEFNGKIVEMKGKTGSVTMIPFNGTVKSDFFNGIVEPCGVDTQISNAAHVRHMSARYMLTGTDSAGKEAHIYVENNGYFNGDNVEMPFHTVPTFLTDSETLADYLHTNKFVGEGVDEEDGLHIYFYEVI